MLDQIILDSIQVSANIGVPDSEREKPQLIEVSIVLYSDLRKAARTDQLQMSIDYAEVHRKTIEIVQERPRHLIETLAEEIAETFIKNFKIEGIDVEVRKFVLEKTRSVAVRISREKVHVSGKLF